MRCTGAYFVDNGGMTSAKQSSRELYLRLLAHVRPYREAVFGVALAMIIGGLADASLVKVGQYVVQEIFVNHNRAYAAILPLAIASSAALGCGS